MQNLDFYSYKMRGIFKDAKPDEQLKLLQKLESALKEPSLLTPLLKDYILHNAWFSKDGFITLDSSLTPLQNYLRGKFPTFILSEKQMKYINKSLE